MLKKSILPLVILLLPLISFGQLNYTSNLDVANADPGEGQWDNNGWNGNTTSPCSVSSMEDNCYGTGTSQIVEMNNSTSIGVSLGALTTVQFDYKILEYNSTTATPAADFKELKVYSGTTNTGPWTLEYTLNSHTSSTSCATQSFTYTPTAGAAFLQFTVEHSNVSSPDFDVYIDNISVIETVCSPTIGTASSIVTNCASGTFDINLLITAATSGGTVTVSDGGTNPNQVVSSFPTTVTFTGYASGSSVTLNADNGTCNVNANTVTENCTFGFSCALAQPITSGFTTSSSITTPGTSGSEEWVTTADASCGGASDAGFENADVHLFSYTTGAVAGESFYFTIDHNSAVDGEHSIGVWSSCINGVLSSCMESTYEFDDVVGVCAQSLAANTTYYIGVGKEWYSIDGTNLDFDVIDFTVETSATLPDDECATATAMDISQPYSGSTRCSYTASAGSPNACGISIENDSWISFTAGSATAIIDYDVSNCTNGNGVQLSAFSGNCGSMTLIPGSCLNFAANNSSGTWTLSGLTIGNTYYIRADGYAGDLCGYSYTPVGGIVVLPITLSNFSGKALNNGYNQINWTTSSEINNDYFELEKSDNGEDFEIVNTQNGAGNSNSTLHYLDYDKPKKEITYYRLKQTDFDGKYSYSDIIAVTNSNKEFKIYPNPSNDGYVYIDNLENVHQIKVLNAKGQVLNQYTSISSNSLKINLSEFKSGLYYIVINTSNRVVTEKILIK